MVIVIYLGTQQKLNHHGLNHKMLILDSVVPQQQQSFDSIFKKMRDWGLPPHIVEAQKNGKLDVELSEIIKKMIDDI